MSSAPSIRNGPAPRPAPGPAAGAAASARAIPLGERSDSQNNRHAIRIVPYTPPRISSDSRIPSRGSSRGAGADGRPSSDIEPGADQEDGHLQVQSKKIWEEGHDWKEGRDDVEEDFADLPGSAPRTPSISPSQPVARSRGRHKDRRVSGSNQAAPSQRTRLRVQSRVPSNPSSSATASVHARPSSRSSSSSSTQRGLRSLSRRRNVVAIHADKTFSLVRRDSRRAPGSVRSQLQSYSSRDSSTLKSSTRQSERAWSATDQGSRPSSPLTGPDTATPEPGNSSDLSAVAPHPPAAGAAGSSASRKKQDPSAPNSTAPYRMIGGIRRVPKTPDLKQQHALHAAATALSSSPPPPVPDTPLPHLNTRLSVYRDLQKEVFLFEEEAEEEEEEEEEGGEEEEDEYHQDLDILPTSLQPKASFASAASAQTGSTTSERTNYKVYGYSSSPVEPSSDSLVPRPISSHTNYEVLGASSAPASPAGDAAAPSFPSPPPSLWESSENYVVYGSPSATSSSSQLALVPAPPRRPLPSYSQESLVVAPLQPGRKRSQDSFGYFKQRSRENLRNAPSLQSLRHAPSLKTLSHAPSLQSIRSFASVFTTKDATQAFLVNPLLITIGPGPIRRRATTIGARGVEALPATAETEAPSQFQQTTWSRTHSRSASESSVVTVRQATRSLPASKGHVTFAPRPFAVGMQAQQPQPHQWSSQLSTVMSESEPGSERDPTSAPGTPFGGSLIGSRSGTATGSGSGRRRSSVGWASSVSGGHNSRHGVMSISSSLAAQLDEANSQNATSSSGIYSSGSGSVSLSAIGAADNGETMSDTSRPRPTLSRASPSLRRTVRDQDEHGDGLADLNFEHPLHMSSSRTGLSGMFMSSNSSSRNLHSSNGSLSSKSNSFIQSAAIPPWARLYYGSGERAWLKHYASYTSLNESISSETRPGSSRSVFRRGGTQSPSNDHFPLSLFTPRKRPREVNPPSQLRPFSDSASLDIIASDGRLSRNSATSYPDGGPMATGAAGPAGYVSPNPPALQDSDGGVVRTIRKKTSSLWSPHLRIDRRASRYSLWEPPRVSWSADSGLLGRRNVQVIAFAVGFIFPFAWMIAAALRLPPNSAVTKEKMMEQGQADEGSDSRNTAPHLSQRQYVQFAVGESRYESARWWRSLNRIMAVVGVLVIAAVITLIVVGVKEGWMSRR